MAGLKRTIFSPEVFIFIPGYLTFCLLLILIHRPVYGQNAPIGENAEFLQTIKGRIDVSGPGYTLTHEHIMSNFGKEPEVSAVYDVPRLLGQTIPYLKHLHSLGVRTIFDCTTAYFGRNVNLLKTISDATGIAVVTNTGIYGAASDRYIPEFAYQKDAEAIANIWITEYKTGIDGTDIRPGFIKLSFDEGTPSAIDLKLFEAGILTHLETGLTIAVHTGDNLAAAKAQMALIRDYKMDPDAWIWVHADQFQDDDILIKFASEGAWISLDGVRLATYPAYVDRILKFKAKNVLDKVLLSHDGNGFPNGGEIRAFDVILTHLIPALISGGCTREEIQLLLVVNPGKAFGIKH